MRVNEKIGDERRGQAGFTLVELLIAMFIAGVIVAGSLGVLNLTRTSGRTERLRLDLQQNARDATDMLTRDLQQAGQGMDPNTSFGVVATADAASGQPDSLFILYVEPDTPDHAVLDPGAGLDKSQVILRITCGDPVDDIGVDDFLYVANGSARGVAHVTAVTPNISGSCSGQPPTFQIGTVTLSVSVVDGEAHGWVLQGNSSGGVALRVRAVAYFLDTSNAANPFLSRATSYQGGSWQAVPIADMVSDVQAELLFRDGDVAAVADDTDADATNDYDDFNTVRVTFAADTRWADKDLAGGLTYSRSYSVSVTPRNQIYTRNLGP